MRPRTRTAGGIRPGSPADDRAAIERVPSSAGMNQGMQMLSYLISGVALYGLLGWAGDHVLGTAFLLPIGIVVGAGLGIYLVIRRLEHAALGAGATGAGAPGTVTPGTVTPGTVTPGTVTPGTVTPGTATPGRVTPRTVTGATTRTGVPGKTGKTGKTTEGNT